MIETLAAHRAPVVEALGRIDRDHGEPLSRINGWGGDLRRRILDFAGSGKVIRGSLVAATAQAFGVAGEEAVYTVAASLELIQSFLLIHDDIMDEDPVRRGKPAVYEQYRRYASENGYRDPDRFGESMAICGGDVAALMAVSAIGATTLSAQTRVRLMKLVTDEIAKVGVAQMADVANGHSPHAASEEEILSVYRYKTGRYTFSLPLMLGAMLAGADEATVDALSRWGELEGIVFQIRDDHLGVMEETTEIGKPAGSDITANKQTLHRLYLFERLADTRWADVAGYFGHAHLSENQIGRVRDALRETGTIATLDALVARLRGEAAAVLGSIALPESAREAFATIDAYNATRSR